MAQHQEHRLRMMQELDDKHVEAVKIIENHLKSLQTVDVERIQREVKNLKLEAYQVRSFHAQAVEAAFKARQRAESCVLLADHIESLCNPSVSDDDEAGEDTDGQPQAAELPGSSRLNLFKRSHSDSRPDDEGLSEDADLHKRRRLQSRGSNGTSRGEKRQKYRVESGVESD